MSISSSMVEHTMITAQESSRRSRAIRRPFFGFENLKKKRVGYPSVMHFEGRLASGLEKICDLLSKIYKCLLILSQNTSRITHLLARFNFLQDLNVNKGSGPDGMLPIILKNCAYAAFANPLSLLFNSSMSTSVFPDRWKVSYVTLIFKKGRRNNFEEYRGAALLSAIPKRFELLVYRGMYNDLENLMSINQHGFMKNRSTKTNLLEYASFVLNSIYDGNQVDFIYTEFINCC
jgi:hypothetical protein